ncbi:ALG6, ALG8 glycosyltransferase [Pseudovirgaria hyperparasitica]|uniref:Alpha-1,3-glucosyltransferase n=1 Tax=Pseudovirgaria hyperparasitica TaxID=470096 RepID=A0A6A6W457_9PEZI|nr:ALG6, ALG8 glycosyltransferase [Pseudovirgaria hyperparasitica]KAF2756690.1 ALG6, ALG8 glycosyltransferase [Pseudovirgaria hyperparasitica]
MSAHKPRRRRRLEDPSAYANHGTIHVDAQTKKQSPAFPLVAFLWPVKGPISQWVLLPLILMVVGLFRWTTGLWGYSGFQSPPMHGDFEAQRHWMEITTHLPASQWYFHDLDWWGLDYPPLTAYHSWVLGKLGNYINPTWFAIMDSRALDDPDLKIYMRATALVSEYLVYVPAVIICLRHLSHLQHINTWESYIALVAILMQPGAILIDHGHFQFNTVMLGLFVASVSSMLAGRHLWGCVFFVGSLGFKQMALFWSPAVFAYLCGICVFPRVRPLKFVGIALITILSFAIVWAPFLFGVVYEQYRNIPIKHLPMPPILAALPFRLDRDALYYPALLQFAQSLHRIFPFARGLFEDKVANFWCALHTFHKLNRYSSVFVQRAALLATLFAIAPPCIIIFVRPKRVLLPLALAATSWGFFLCSYQVHEKNVLLPLLPMTLLLSGQDGLLPSVRAWVGFANMLGIWTMFPLLKRDELRVPYFALGFLWAYLMGLPPTSLSAYRSGIPGGLNTLTKLIHLSFYVGMIVWHVAEGFVEPPENKPDLWVVANVLGGAPGFGICYIWCVWTLLKESHLVAWASPKAEPMEKKSQ